ncbi:MAG: PepSY-associated TM helix domain-containing protein [Planctomycetaceae bacterium]
MGDSPTPAPAPAKAWPDYRAVWRWHFYANFFCLPFVVILAITGGIYLFKPQIEASSDARYDNLTLSGPRPSAEKHVRAALAALPDASLVHYELPQAEDKAIRVIVRSGDVSHRVFVHPTSLEVLGHFPENERFSRLIFRIHGELMLGDRGSMLVELAASWTIIMILTGIYLWWPRQSRGLGGILYPRLTQGSRIFWRDIHSVTGIWISGLTLLLLISGLPWSKSWGNYLKAVRKLTGTSVAQQEWSNSSEGGAGKRAAKPATGGDHAGHGDHGGGKGGSRKAAPPLPKDLTAIDRIAETLTPMQLQPPVQIAPPAKESQPWTAKSMTANRPWRVNLTLDGETGKVLSQNGFREKHWIDKLVAIGIAAHEGQLFGWPNQVIGLLTVLGLLLLCFSGLVMWWRRRDPGSLGALKEVARPRFAIGLLIIVLALGIYLPLFGTSLILVVLLERFVLRRIPSLRNWLGLSPPALQSAT